MKYYAVCNVHGPISRRIDAKTVEEAVTIFGAADTAQWIDAPAIDAEEDLDIEGEGMSEDQFADALLRVGCRPVMDLDEIAVGQGPAQRTSHLADGWILWQLAD